MLYLKLVCPKLQRNWICKFVIVWCFEWSQCWHFFSNVQVFILNRFTFYSQLKKKLSSIVVILTKLCLEPVGVLKVWLWGVKISLPMTAAAYDTIHFKIIHETCTGVAFWLAQYPTPTMCRVKRTTHLCTSWGVRIGHSAVSTASQSVSLYDIYKFAVNKIVWMSCIEFVCNSSEVVPQGWLGIMIPSFDGVICFIWAPPVSKININIHLKSVSCLNFIQLYCYEKV